MGRRHSGGGRRIRIIGRVKGIRGIRKVAPVRKVRGPPGPSRFEPPALPAREAAALLAQVARQEAKRNAAPRKRAPSPAGGRPSLFARVLRWFTDGFDRR